MMVPMMAQTFRPCLIVVLALLASGCGQGDTSPGPGPANNDEARALSEAAEMIGEVRASPTPSAGPAEPSTANDRAEAPPQP